MLILGTTEGRYEQHLINTLGPIELWAFSTSAEDVAIRNRLYARLGAGQARRLLAANFPGGSARSEIRRRVADLAEKGEMDKASVSAVIEAMVDDMVISVQKELLGEDEDSNSGTDIDGEEEDVEDNEASQAAAKSDKSDGKSEIKAEEGNAAQQSVIGGSQAQASSENTASKSENAAGGSVPNAVRDSLDAAVSSETTSKTGDDSRGSDDDKPV